MTELAFIISITVLIMSVVLHELSHGYVAEMLGDPTPRLQGRLTINPIKHLDFLGSFIVPLLTSLAGFPFGWAKPIQWNPYNVKNRRLGELLISIAGPASNILIAVVFGLLIRFGAESLPQSFLVISAYIVIINITLAVFNLIPIPPLDGSKVLFSLLPPYMSHFRAGYERYSLFLVLILLFVLWKYIAPIIPFFFQLITGTGF
ncbi:MAG: site-2 protease family protein [bacterium]|nr:site-2 protease family protein [bacterium]